MVNDQKEQLKNPCWKQYSIYVGWFLNTGSWKPWQRTSIRVGDNCRIGIHIWDQHFLLMFRLGTNRCLIGVSGYLKPSPSRFFPTHKPWLISGPHFYSRDPALPSSETASWLRGVPPSWCLSYFFGRSIFFLLSPVQPETPSLGKDDDWMMITLIDHLITKPLMFCLDRDGWTHTLQHAFRKFQSGFFVLALSLNYLKHLLILYNRCISVGTRKGYSLTNCDPFGRVYTMSACSFKIFSYIRPKHAIQMMVPEG